MLKFHGEQGIGDDSAEGRSGFQRRMEQRRSEGEAMGRGWRLGAGDFLERLSEKLGRRKRH